MRHITVQITVLMCQIKFWVRQITGQITVPMHQIALHGYLGALVFRVPLFLVLV
jgi:hypothetical protein